MKTEILRALRAEAQNWWAHKDLRAAGRIDEARARERTSIRGTVESLRAALTTHDAYVCCGRGGTTVHYGGTTISSHGSLKHFAMARIAIVLGLPFVDTQPVANPIRLIGLPLVAGTSEVDPKPWGPMSRVPLTEYAARARALGAVTLNMPSQEVSNA